MSTSRPPLAFTVLDLETTGLDPVEDRITEIAVVGVDENLNELFSFETVIEPTEATWRRLAQNTIPREMADANGLLGALRDPEGRRMTIEQAERALLAILAEFTPHERAFVIGGSGVGSHDVPFLRQHMPALMREYAYYPHDTGVIRREWARATGHQISDANLSKTHRAMDDVRCHLDEARTIRATLRLAGELIYGKAAA